jgi:hypothetical protein
MKGTVSGSSSNWSSTGLAGSFDQVTALAFDPSGNLYAGASALNATGGGIYKLASGGSTWTSANSGITSTTIDAIAVDPNATSTVYASAAATFIRLRMAARTGRNLARRGYLRRDGDRQDHPFFDGVCGIQRRLDLQH